MAEASADDQYAGRIEGGIEAVVLGASADGLTAAAYLGQAGLKTVLLDTGAEIGGAIRQREFTPDATCVDGEHLIHALDPETIADLDLYRHGVAYASRRMDTVYFFEDGQSLTVDGDLSNAAASIDEAAGGGPPFQMLAQEALEMAAQLRPAFEVALAGRGRARQRALTKAADSSSDAPRRLNHYLLSSGSDVLDGYLPDGLLKTAMLAEIGFRSAAPPGEPFSFMNLIRRWAGEASGLQGAIAYPHGGAVTVINALRRAVQAAKVEIRAASPFRKILVERDQVAGVQLENGGQIRAPIVIAALDARRTFLNLMGARDIDIEFQRAITASSSVIAPARLHLMLEGFARDDQTREKLAKRLLYAPSADRLARAFAAARAGDVPEDLIVEAIFPAAIEGAADDNHLLLSAMAHPLPLDPAPDDARRDAIAAAIKANIEKFAPGVADRIEASDVSLPADLAATAGMHPAAFASRPGVLQQWALAGQMVTAGGVDGLYFCGPEAQIGPGVTCTAGRIAAKTAIRRMKRGVMAA